MDKVRVPLPSRLFQYSLIETKDELEEKYEGSYQALLQTIQGKGDKEISDSLHMEAMKSHENICRGLLVGILTEQGNSIKYYSYLGFVANDGLSFVVCEVNRLLVEKYSSLKEVVQHQLIWLVRELIRSGIAGADDVCYNVLRNIIGGNTSTRNLWLSDQMMNILMENKSWLYSSPNLVSGVIYTYLRLLQDHVKPNLKEFGEKEVSFVIHLVRERFSDVLTLGRDFVRLLQLVARIPEIEEIWQEILHSPSTLAPNFTGLEQLMKTRTPRKFLISRITPSMEKKLIFLTQNVKFGSHTPYQGWFQRDHLSSPESQSLRPDIIRFLVSVVHPSNEILQSAVTPRWAVIGWMLTTSTNQVTSANVKLALFYDWVFFNPPSDNIMDLEPAVLVMQHSMKPHPQVTATLLDFLTRLVNSFYTPFRDQIILNVTSAFKQVVETGVLSRLSPLIFNTYLSGGLRNSLKSTFQTLYLLENPPVQKVKQMHITSPSVPTETVQFSDDEDNSDEEKLVVIQDSPDKKIVKSLTNGDGKGDSSVTKLISKIEGISQADAAQQSELLSQAMKSFLARPVFAEDCKLLAESLSDNMSAQFQGKLCQSPVSQASLQVCLSQPIFSLFLCLTDPRKDPVMELLASLHFLQPRLGYYLLVFLTTSPESEISQDDKISLYTEFCQAMDTDCGLKDCLVRHLTQCQEDDVDLFLYLIPHLFHLLPHSTLGNVPLFYLIVSCVDGAQIQSLVSKIVSQQLVLLHGDTCQSIMEASLTWETFEQYAFWHIYNAHELPILLIQNFVPKLSAKLHSEALTNVLFILKKKKPNEGILAKCLAREPAGDDFLSSLCCFWMKYIPKVLTELVASYVNKHLEGSRKRKADPRIQEKPTTLQLLGHFTPVMKACKDLFENTEVLEAFSKLSQSCLESTKLNHPIFFEIIESLLSQHDSEEEDTEQPSSDNDSPPPNPKLKKKTTVAKPRRQSASVNYREVESSDDEEDNILPRMKKRRL